MRQNLVKYLALVTFVFVLASILDPRPSALTFAASNYLLVPHATPYVLDLAQNSTPACPASGFDLLYFKSDDNLYKQTSACVETQISGGGGGGITALTGQVAASGSGSVVATVANDVNKVYVDFVSGNDSTGTGNPIAPWKTLQYACNHISPTINIPIAIYLSGGNNDTDSAPITCPPNITLTAASALQISQNFSITGGSTNDTVSFENITFVGTLTWVRNDATAISMGLINTGLFGLVDFEQQGSGVAQTFFSATGGNTALSGGATIRAGQANIYGTGVISGTLNYKDSGAAYLLLNGGDLYSLNIELNGGITAEFSGAIADSSYTIVGATTGTGTPVILSDSGSIPPSTSITGAFSLLLTSLAPHVSYTPAVTGNWSPVPTLVSSALDQLAARGPFLSLSGGTMTGAINMGAHQINAVSDPTLAQDAATKHYVDTNFLKASNNLSDVASSTVAFNNISPTTTKGDLIINSGTSNVRLAACIDGDQLQYDSTQTNGVKCVVPAGGSSPRNMLRLNTPNGYGSTNTNVRRWTTTVSTTGSGFTYTDSAANGGSVTINTAGVWAVMYCDFVASVSTNLGLVLNGTQGATAIESITASTRLMMAQNASGGQPACVSWTGILAVNDVVWAQSDGTSGGNNAENTFTLTQVSN